MKDDHVAALLERIEDKLARFAESMADVPKDIAILKQDVAELKSDMKVVKAVSTGQSRDISECDRRITILENS